MRSKEFFRLAPNDRQLRGHARVGDHHVKPAEMFDRGFDRGLDLLAVADITDDGERVAAFGRDLGELIGLDPREHDARPTLM